MRARTPTSSSGGSTACVRLGGRSERPCGSGATGQVEWAAPRWTTGCSFTMLTRAFFALLLIAFPVALAVKIRTQRRALGRSPLVLGVAADDLWARWFERFSLFGLLVWPATWLWILLGAAPLNTNPGCAVGMVIMAAGASLSLASVFLMGRAWRIGIDPENRTELAEDGPYRWVRHPIYSGWLLILIGNVLVVPHLAVDVAALLTAVGVAYQAHREERHLLSTFGERYARYAARTGRFIPRPWRRRAPK